MSAVNHLKCSVNKETGVRDGISRVYGGKNYRLEKVIALNILAERINLDSHENRMVGCDDMRLLYVYVGSTYSMEFVNEQPQNGRINKIQGQSNADLLTVQEWPYQSVSKMLQKD
jgi:hypothetical protein